MFAVIHNHCSSEDYFILHTQATLMVAAAVGIVLFHLATQKGVHKEGHSVKLVWFTFFLVHH